MIDVKTLKAEFVKKGLKQADVAKHLNISPKTLCLKLKKGIIRSDEIESLIEFLKIKKTLNIFLTKK